MVRVYFARTPKGRFLFCSSDYKEVEKKAKEMTKDTGETYVIVG